MARQAKIKVYLTGDNPQEATLAPIQQALDFARFTDIARCDVIHAANWSLLLNVPQRLLVGKHVIAHCPDDLSGIDQRGFETARRLVSLWIVRSAQAKALADSWGLNSHLIPQTLDGAQRSAWAEAYVRLDALPPVSWAQVDVTPGFVDAALSRFRQARKRQIL